MSGLSITSVIRSTGVVVLVLRGSLGHADLAGFRAVLCDTLRAQRPVRLEVDFAGVLDVDSGAAGALASAICSAASADTLVTVAHAPAVVGRELRLHGGGSLRPEPETPSTRPGAGRSCWTS
ncbi:STAS domain-containing protein [Micromonospora sp. 15K316]|uniref:STAS domain-containing protein n=1 Tax=Micromonospora sp. 15K316 TaxID=2530376 RepID=UPI00104578E2|nr:STAS domain-containing protein [Micromonospora sp. 15K316]TDC36762.1 STAS domain-containing protein [Micromonospora sp. 15K316]